ncbi:hypothetical protein [Clostridium botulinum]|uniref:hypothetical protein n=1 Tax=Clostridium botulinum TaxID=1491 RepID=UPI001FA89789|nr:hypothetical protein [Clostridium botulinum]
MLRKFTNKELSEIEEIQYAKKVLNEEGVYSYQNQKYVYFYNNNKELIRIDNNLESKMENYYELNESMKEIYEKTYKEYKSKKLESDVMIMLEKIYKEIKRNKGLQTNTTLAEDMINTAKLLENSFKKINEECNMSIENKLEQLNDYIIENLNMELMDNKITEVSKTIEGWEKVIKSEEFKDDNIESNLEIIQELKKYKGYDCVYSTDYKYGGCWGQGFVIIDQNLNYVDFVRTI